MELNNSPPDWLTIARIRFYSTYYGINLRTVARESGITIPSYNDRFNRLAWNRDSAERILSILKDRVRSMDPYQTD